GPGLRDAGFGDLDFGVGEVEDSAKLRQKRRGVAHAGLVPSEYPVWVGATLHRYRDYPGPRSHNRPARSRGTGSADEIDVGAGRERHVHVVVVVGGRAAAVFHIGPAAAVVV